MSEPHERLPWPPKKEDLERLYLGERLSAAKIAQVYGLKYASPKTTESTVLYQLKRNGIKRRGRTDHIKKVSSERVDGWVRRYKGGESLKQIAGGSVAPVTVWNYLKARGVVLRGKVEAQIKAVTKHERRPFDGSKQDEAYLVGFAKGDCQALRRGRGVRVRTSTTHPAQANLFESLFSPYGYVHKYPRPSVLTGFEWSLEVDLDSSFSFLLMDPRLAFEKYSEDTSCFLSFLSGFFDAEGSVLFHKKGEYGAFELSIANMNHRLLSSIGSKLAALGYSPIIGRSLQKQGRGVKNGKDHIWKLNLYRFVDVQKLLQGLEVRHPEKIEEISVARTLPSGPASSALAEVGDTWKQMRARIKVQRNRFVDQARVILLSRKETGVRKEAYFRALEPKEG